MFAITRGSHGQKWSARTAALAAAGLLALADAGLVACNGPIVARSPETLYALAQEQIGNANYYPAVDTLARVSREAPDSEVARRARLLRVTLLAGMAQTFKDIGESYLKGYEKAGAAAYAGQMRAVAVDYFGRSRQRTLEMLEALDLLLREPAPGPARLEFTLPATPSDATDLLGRVRQGHWVEVQQLSRVEKQELAIGLARVSAALTAGGGREVDPARLYVTLARGITELSNIYRPEALSDRRMVRLLHERAASAASRAAQWAQQKGDRGLEEESQQLLAHCQDVLKKL